MAHGLSDGARLPNSAHEARPWRIREIVPDFRLEDVWALPARGDADDFPVLLALASSLDPAHSDSRATRFLWELRDRLGKWFGLGRTSVEAARGAGSSASGLSIPGTEERSLAARLPQDLRGTTVEGEFGALFTPLYRTKDEAAAEISNRTVHGVVHFGWVERAEGRYQGEMAVYVKPRGAFGQGYMALIKPFRHLVVYPALMRQFERAWDAERQRPGGS
jgi:hypothetical protein